MTESIEIQPDTEATIAGGFLSEASKLAQMQDPKFAIENDLKEVCDKLQFITWNGTANLFKFFNRKEALKEIHRELGDILEKLPE